MFNYFLFVDTLQTPKQRIKATDIFHDNQNGMYQIAYAILKNTDDAEDAVMLAVRKICMHIDQFMNLDEKTIQLKVNLITKCTAIDLYRKRSKKRRMFRDLTPYAFDIETCTEEAVMYNTYGDDIMFDCGDFGDLQKYVLQLDEKYKLVLLLFYGEELSVKEISQRLGIPESTVTTHIHRAKQKLKKMLGKDEKGRS